MLKACFSQMKDVNVKTICDLSEERIEMGKQLVIEKGGYTLDELMAYLYAIPREVYGELDDKELKKCLGKFFQNVYTLLISKTKGPRLYLFLYAIEPEKYLHLLDF